MSDPEGEDYSDALRAIEARRNQSLREFGQQHELAMLWMEFAGPPVNPVYAWEAVRFCDERQIPFPQWVYDYLAQSARNIVAIVREPEATSGDTASFMKALGMLGARGHPSAFSAVRHSAPRERACVEFAWKFSREALIPKHSTQRLPHRSVSVSTR
jgi:hypothetical protein